MAATINASTSPAGIIQTADGTANLSLQSNGTTIAALTSTGMAVTGTLSASGVTTFAAGTAALPAITTTGDTDTGIWFPAANTVAASTSGTERMRIDSSGNLLVGLSSSPLSKVHFRGGDDNTMSIDNDGSRFTTANWRNNGTYKSGVFYDNTDSKFYIQHNAGGVYLALNATSWSANSDERQKDIIEPIENALTKVNTLRAIIGKYKTDEEGVRRSFLIAQDVQAVLPEAVEASNPDNLGVQYTDVIPLLVAAIKEQQALITSLTARITALEGA